ncbi:carotenoid oxygenase family protein [Streptomyces sp. NPDC088348]|uniref:carotenoid oxygenase family protein n=1 Tax=Streptomyces sp. NPDC088348 TaxID=3365853 RepID=UPI0038092894
MCETTAVPPNSPVRTGSRRPCDPRHEHAYDRGVECFRAAAELFTPRVEPVTIPYEGTTLPGYLRNGRAEWYRNCRVRTSNLAGGPLENPVADTGWLLRETQGGRVHRWRLDPATGTVSEQPLDDRGVELPTINDDLTGRPSRYLYTVTENAILKYDTLAGTSQAYGTGNGSSPGEAVFVPAHGAGAPEDAGWLLSMVEHGTAHGSELLVLDAQGMTRVATVEMPRRVPAGVHGSWVPDQQAQPVIFTSQVTRPAALRSFPGQQARAFSTLRDVESGSTRDRPLPMSLTVDASVGDALSVLFHFRGRVLRLPVQARRCLFELADALLYTDGPVETLVEFCLTAEHRSGHGAMYARVCHAPSPTRRSRGW